MAISEDLVYFLKNGKLKNINFGASEKQFIEVLGEPDINGEIYTDTRISNSISGKKNGKA